MPDKASPVKGIIKSLGLVFGDIGTSPIYTLTVIFLLPTIVRTEDSVIGVLSLIVWTLVILVTVEYAWLAMSLGRRGEGGTIVLRELLVPLLKSSRQATVVTLLSFIGISLIIGDGVITPAISILSAVEGRGLSSSGIPMPGTCCSRWCIIRRTSSISRSCFSRSLPRSSRRRP